VTAVVSANSGGGTDAASVLDGFHAGIAVVAAIAALGLAVAAAGVLRESRERSLAAAEALPEREAA
jgi:hypothetical protein